MNHSVPHVAVAGLADRGGAEVEAAFVAETDHPVDDRTDPLQKADRLVVAGLDPKERKDVEATNWIRW